MNEVTEARRVVAAVVPLLRSVPGTTVIEIHDNVRPRTQTANINYLVAEHNRNSRDLDVSVHFNSTGKGLTDRAIGTEVLYFSAQDLAVRVSKAIAGAGGFIDRGGKRRTNISWLARTNRPAIMLEICFTDSRADSKLYFQNFQKICEAIAASVLGRSSITTSPPTVTVPPQQKVCPTCHRPL